MTRNWCRIRLEIQIKVITKSSLLRIKNFMQVSEKVILLSFLIKHSSIIRKNEFHEY